MGVSWWPTASSRARRTPTASHGAPPSGRGDTPSVHGPLCGFVGSHGRSLSGVAACGGPLVDAGCHGRSVVRMLSATAFRFRASVQVAAHSRRGDILSVEWSVECPTGGFVVCHGALVLHRSLPLCTTLGCGGPSRRVVPRFRLHAGPLSAACFRLGPWCLVAGCGSPWALCRRPVGSHSGLRWTVGSRGVLVRHGVWCGGASAGPPGPQRAGSTVPGA